MASERATDRAPHVRRLLHVFATFDAGGPQVRTVRMLQPLADGWHHHFLALNGRTGAAELLPPTGMVSIESAPPRAGSVATTARLLRLLRRIRPDLVASYNWGAIDAAMAARIAAIPFVHHEETVADDERGLAALRRDLARRWLLRRARAVVVPSRALRTKASHRWRIPAPRLHHVPNGIDLRDHEPRDGRPALRARLGIDPRSAVVGFVGHLRPEKGLDRLLHACTHVRARDVVLLVVGDGSERAAAAALAGRLGISHRVRFAGHQAHPAEHFRCMDVFALASHREEMPVALLEAMAHALPVVATAVGDVVETLPPEQRRHVVASDALAPEAMARHLDLLLSGRELRARLGAANRRWTAAQHSHSAMISRYRSIYGGAVAGAAAPDAGEARECR
jgi:glycosyltransferase involved in cell wall biosynthesis